MNLTEVFNNLTGAFQSGDRLAVRKALHDYGATTGDYYINRLGLPAQFEREAEFVARCMEQQLQYWAEVRTSEFWAEAQRSLGICKENFAVELWDCPEFLDLWNRYYS